jgi:hypothetical protein
MVIARRRADTIVRLRKIIVTLAPGQVPALCHA